MEQKAQKLSLIPDIKYILKVRVTMTEKKEKEKKKSQSAISKTRHIAGKFSNVI